MRKEERERRNNNNRKRKGEEGDKRGREKRERKEGKIFGRKTGYSKIEILTTYKTKERVKGGNARIKTKIESIRGGERMRQMREGERLRRFSHESH